MHPNLQVKDVLLLRMREYRVSGTCLMQQLTKQYRTPNLLLPTVTAHPARKHTICRGLQHLALGPSSARPGQLAAGPIQVMAQAAICSMHAYIV
jgi:hypothetical protein